ncbi:MAG: hypothetical protein OXH22_05090 [Chloroflexi bacterium]|nr:hypothetical protein [Chloroflexota bacterium]
MIATHDTTTQQQQLDFSQSVQSAIVEQTDNGRTIVEFLISVMEGHLTDFKECHRIDAARLLQKFGYGETRATANTASPAAKRESRDADKRIQSELAQIIQEETDNGRIIVTFLVQAMNGELPDFKPCHRMSACKELLRLGTQPAAETEAASSSASNDTVEEPDPEKQARQHLLNDAKRFSLHGPLYYEVHPFPCPCETRRTDCKGNELSEEERKEVLQKAPGLEATISDPAEQEAFKKEFADFMARLNPDKPPIDINSIRWRKLTHDP